MPKLSRPPHPARRGIPRRCARIRDAIVIAEGILDVVESQDASRGVIAVLVHEMDRHAAASAAAVFEDGVGEGSDLLEGEGCALGEETWWFPLY